MPPLWRAVRLFDRIAAVTTEEKKTCLPGLCAFMREGRRAVFILKK